MGKAEITITESENGVQIEHRSENMEAMTVIGALQKIQYDLCRIITQKGQQTIETVGVNSNGDKQ